MTGYWAMGINGKDEVFKNKNTFKAKYQQYLEAVIFFIDIKFTL